MTTGMVRACENHGNNVLYTFYFFLKNINIYNIHIYMIYIYIYIHMYIYIYIKFHVTHSQGRKEFRIRNKIRYISDSASAT